MAWLRSLLLVTVVSVATFADGKVHRGLQRRTGEDTKDKDSSSLSLAPTIISSSVSTPAASKDSTVISLKDPTFSTSTDTSDDKDKPSTTSSPSKDDPDKDKDKDYPITSSSSFNNGKDATALPAADKDKWSSTSSYVNAREPSAKDSTPSVSDKDKPLSTSSVESDKDKTATTVPSKDLTTSFPDKDKLTRTSSDVPDKDKTTTSVQAKDLTTTAPDKDKLSPTTSAVPDKDKTSTSVPAKDVISSAPDKDKLTSSLPVPSKSQALSSYLSDKDKDKTSPVPAKDQPTLTLPDKEMPSAIVANVTSTTQKDKLTASGPPVIVYSITVPLLGTSVPLKQSNNKAASTSVQELPFPPKLTSAPASDLNFLGYGIVPSPKDTRGKLKVVNETSAIPVWTAELLGNAYGGGFPATPSIYVTRLAPPNGPSHGIPPGYGAMSKPEITPSSSLASTYPLGKDKNFTILSFPPSFRSDKTSSPENDNKSKSEPFKSEGHSPIGAPSLAVVTLTTSILDHKASAVGPFVNATIGSDKDKPESVKAIPSRLVPGDKDKSLLPSQSSDKSAFSAKDQAPSASDEAIRGFPAPQQSVAGSQAASALGQSGGYKAASSETTHTEALGQPGLAAQTKTDSPLSPPGITKSATVSTQPLFGSLIVISTEDTVTSSLGHISAATSPLSLAASSASSPALTVPPEADKPAKDKQTVPLSTLAKTGAPASQISQGSQGSLLERDSTLKVEAVQSLTFTVASGVHPAATPTATSSVEDVAELQQGSKAASESLVPELAASSAALIQLGLQSVSKPDTVYASRQSGLIATLPAASSPAQATQNPFGGNSPPGSGQVSVSSSLFPKDQPPAPASGPVQGTASNPPQGLSAATASMKSEAQGFPSIAQSATALITPNAQSAGRDSPNPANFDSRGNAVSPSASATSYSGSQNTPDVASPGPDSGAKAGAVSGSAVALTENTALAPSSSTNTTSAGSIGFSLSQISPKPLASDALSNSPIQSAGAPGMINPQSASTATGSTAANAPNAPDLVNPESSPVAAGSAAVNASSAPDSPSSDSPSAQTNIKSASESNNPDEALSNDVGGASSSFGTSRNTTGPTFNVGANSSPLAQGAIAGNGASGNASTSSDAPEALAGPDAIASSGSSTGSAGNATVSVNLRPTAVTIFQGAGSRALANPSLLFFCVFTYFIIS